MDIFECAVNHFIAQLKTNLKSLTARHFDEQLMTLTFKFFKEKQFTRKV